MPKKNKQTERTLAGTPQQLWPITAGPDTNLKKGQEILKNTAIQEKLQLHTTSYWTRQGISTITFSTQIDLNERGSSQSEETPNADL